MDSPSNNLAKVTTSKVQCLRQIVQWMPSVLGVQFKANKSERDLRNVGSTQGHYHHFIVFLSLSLLLSTATYLAISLGRANTSTDVNHDNHYLQRRK